MHNIFALLAKYIGIPLLEKLFKWGFSELKKWQAKRKIIKTQEGKTDAIENAKTPDAMRSAHRSNKL